MFKKDKIFFYLLFLTLGLAFLLRFYQLGSLPPSMNSDEVALGYNAYSILKTGRDEYGQKLPLSLRSFDDFKPPLYSYLVIPAIYLFGKNPFSVRLPAAVFGFLTVILVFFIVYKLTKNKWLSLTSIFLISTCPWHIQYSRVAYEPTVSLFFITAGIFLFLEARERGYFLIPSAICFGASLFTYHSARLLSLVFVLLLVAYFWYDFLKKKKWVVIAFVVGILITWPVIKIMQTPEGQLRPFVVSIFADTQPKEVFRERIQRDLILGIPFGNLWHNRRFIYLTPFLKSYLGQFRPDFLFASDEKHHAPEIGLLYLWQIPFIFLGVNFLLMKEKPKYSSFIILWFIFSPLAAGLTQQAPSPHRALPVVIPLQIIVAYGLFFSLAYLREKIFFLAKLTTLLISIVVIGSLVYYIHMYFIHSPYEISPLWGYGKEQAVYESQKMESSYKIIYVSTEISQAYIYFLFFSNYDPEKYLSEGGTVSGGFREMKNKFGKHEFHLFDTPCEGKGVEDTLLIWDASETKPCTQILRTIKYPDGRPSIFIGISKTKQYD